MDYLTSPISRYEIRNIAIATRKLFKCKNKFYFDVVEAFERMHYLFPNVVTRVITDDDTENINDLNCPAACQPYSNDKFVIFVREKTYEDAVKGKGGPRAHIMHEISHFILFKLNYIPSLERSFRNNEITPVYRSCEWQAKALAGEILVPYNQTTLMSARSIMKRCQVSRDCAQRRISLDKEL